ncbi:hypothetical protein [Vibrio nigripulchritudo]|uniref:hypothetical protein n=1 Tax=Vibrio nigripulchritudo TaxID=28173 RepID=UPI002492FD64|nr:hypothetical protein [Vibrio nigripulchritudo]BDU35918.1 hypothetical protein TUMSATVNIG2_03870 [Vibrio nigripulchritudo]BDU41590.1 hypothetical protein TUMSATVNIG3_03880 [Vibrio nigripulchritudo]
MDYIEQGERTMEQRAAGKLCVDRRIERELEIAIQWVIKECGDGENCLARQAESLGILDLGHKKNAPIGWNTGAGTKKLYNPLLMRDLTPRLRDDKTPTAGEKTPMKGTVYSGYSRFPGENEHGSRALLLKDVEKDLKDTLPSIERANIVITDKSSCDWGVSVWKLEGEEEPLSDVAAVNSISKTEPGKVRSGLVLENRGVGILVLREKEVEDYVGTQSGGVKPNLVQLATVRRLLRTERAPMPSIIDESVSAEGRPHKKESVSVDLEGTIAEGLDLLVEVTGEYKVEMLNMTRKTVKTCMLHLGDDEREVRSKFEVVQTPEGFETYPCLVLEPRKWKGKLKALNLSVSDLTDLLRSDYHGRHGASKSLANRASFGFVNPTIGDVGSAVRIWPGLLPQDYTIGLFNESWTPKGNEGERLTYDDYANSNIRAALVRVAAYGSTLLAACAAVNPPEQWRPFMRRVGKGINKLGQLEKLILKMGEINEKSPVPTSEFIRQLVRQLDNLTESNLIILALLNVKEPSLMAKIDKVYEEAWTSKMNSISEKYKCDLVHSATCNSGMDALRKCLRATGGVDTLCNAEEAVPIYYEGKSVIAMLSEENRKRDRTGIPLVKILLDLSHNLTCKGDGPSVTHRKAAMERTVMQSTDDEFGIYDGTNTCREEILEHYKSLLEEKEKGGYLLIFESLSKHFQFGMDKTTLGRVEAYYFKGTAQRSNHEKIIQEIKGIKDSHLGGVFSHYVHAQSNLYEQDAKTLQDINENVMKAIRDWWEGEKRACMKSGVGEE